MFKNLINLLFPKVCLGCESFLLTNENVICTSCRHEIPLTQHSKNPENEAIKKFYGRINVEYASTLMYYHKKGIVQEIIHSLKYRGHEQVGTVFGEWFAEDLKSATIPKFGCNYSRTTSQEKTARKRLQPDDNIWRSTFKKFRS